LTTNPQLLPALPAFAFEIDRFFKWRRDHGENLFLLMQEQRFRFGVRGSRKKTAGLAALTPPSAQLNKTFCYLFTQKRRLFEMIIRTHLS
jgi:hypothetical protein